MVMNTEMFRQRLSPALLENRLLARAEISPLRYAAVEMTEINGASVMSTGGGFPAVVETSQPEPRCTFLPTSQSVDASRSSSYKIKGHRNTVSFNSTPISKASRSSALQESAPSIFFICVHQRNLRLHCLKSEAFGGERFDGCLLYTSPSPRD